MCAAFWLSGDQESMISIIPERTLTVALSFKQQNTGEILLPIIKCYANVNHHYFPECHVYLDCLILDWGCCKIGQILKIRKQAEKQTLDPRAVFPKCLDLRDQRIQFQNLETGIWLPIV